MATPPPPLNPPTPHAKNLNHPPSYPLFKIKKKKKKKKNNNPPPKKKGKHFPPPPPPPSPALPIPLIQISQKNYLKKVSSTSLG